MVPTYYRVVDNTFFGYILLDSVHSLDVFIAHYCSQLERGT